MLKFKGIGSSFNNNDHENDIRFKSVSGFNIPKKAKWLNNNSCEREDVFFWMDNAIPSGLKFTNQYGWILESRPYMQNVIDHILSNIENYKNSFNTIFTYQLDLVHLGDPFKLILPPAAPWVKPENKRIWDKTKLISMLVSNANSLPGHHFRLNYLNENKHLLDVFGRGIRDVKNTEEAYIDYKFTVSMENDTHDIFFTERLTSPMCTGTVPIYWGSKLAVEKYFDSKGVLWVDKFKLEDLNDDLYQSLLPHIKNNFEIAAFDFPTPEDYIIENYFL
jgi:hypothetical protein